jgi:RNA polymerase sigma-70 factor, ECF subfamily
MMDRNSIEQVEKLLPYLHRYAMFLTKDACRAEDLVQDSLERAFTRFETFRPGTNLRAWLFRILYHCFINLTRQYAREGVTVELDGWMDHVVSAPAQQDRVLLGQIARRFSRLPSYQQAALALVAIEGLTYEEAAEVLGISVGTVKSRVSRARDALRDWMEQEAPAMELAA